MSLPTGGPWPPYPQGIALAQQALWSAWLVGDPEGLTAAYTETGSETDSAFFNYENGRAGSPPQVGVLNRVARFFWSRPSVSGQRKARLHVPLAADIATASSDLLFAEPPQFILEDGAQPAIDRVDAILNDGDFHAHLVEAAELAAALGGAWLRLVWDKDVADAVMIDTVSADCALGEWRWGQLVAVTFFTEYPQGKGDQEVIRHLERHEPGAVYHGLYSGDAKTLGHAEALDAHSSTEPYVGLVDDTGAIPTGVKGLTAAYVANMRPQRRWRKVEPLAELGRSDYDGCEPLMDALDETYTSWMRDIRLAKARLLVPEDMLTSLGKGEGATFDYDQEVFTGLNIMQAKETPQAIVAQQFAIRVAEHMQTADAITEQILDAAGYSPSSFGRGGNAVATATEVSSRDAKSERTRSKKTRYWEQALEPLLTTWLELDGIVFGGRYAGEVTMQWPEEAQTDALTLAQTANMLALAKAASTKTLVSMQHEDWDEAEVDAEVQLIQDEQGMNVPSFGPPLGGHINELTPQTGA